MEERDKCLKAMKKVMLGRLQDQVHSNRDAYLATVKMLILQGMIKLIEPSLQIKCREEDVSDIKAMLPDLQSQYHDFMKEKTLRDEYECELSVVEDLGYLGKDRDHDCGGIVLYTANSCIVCPNTIFNRLNLCFEEMLPQIRSTLFPNADKK